MTKSDFIFMLVRSALWQQPLAHFDMSPRQYREVMEEADKQCILGLITDCLRTNNMGLQKKCVIHMLKLQNTLMKENHQIDEHLCQLVALLQGHDIHPVVVKGQTIGALYPKPGLRVPGDIDFYVHAADRQATMDLVAKEWGVEEFDHNPDGKEIGFTVGKIVFELHNTLLMFEDKKHGAYFNQLVDNSQHGVVSVAGHEVGTLEPTLNVFYTFCHLYHHFRSEGVAIRQLCDLTMLLHAHHGTIDRERLAEMLRKTGYTHAFATFGCLLIEKLGLPADEMPVDITDRDRKTAKEVLKVILEGGNWGNYSRKDYDKHSLHHALETGWIRIKRYLSFFHLSPSENFSLLIKEIPRRTTKLIKRIVKGKP